MIVGRKVRLRRPENRGPDHQIIVAWRNDPSLKSFFFDEEPITLESHLAWYDRISQDTNQRFYVIDALIEPGTAETACDPPLLVGTIGLSHIDWRNRTTEAGRWVIGDAAYRGGGYATESLYLLLDHAFNYMNLHKVWAEILAWNKVCLDAIRPFGFRDEGLLRQQAFKEGKYWDVIRVGLLAEDFLVVQPSVQQRLGLAHSATACAVSQDRIAREV